MEIFIVDVMTNYDFPESISCLSKDIKNGKVAVLPTDTVYGLSCIAVNKKAIDRIYKIKKRDKDKPLLVLVGSYHMLHDYFFVSVKQEKFLRTVWPPKTKDIGSPDLKLRPTTVILKSRGKFPENLNAGSENVAVRLPNDKFLATLIKQIGAPIVSTSLNISGKENLTSLEALDTYFKKEKPDLVVDSGKLKNKKPSKLLDIIDMDNIKKIRG